MAKFQAARHLRAVVVSTPTCVKSFMLKYIEICHLLNRQKDHMQETKETASITKLTIAQRLGLRPKPLRPPFLPEEEIRNLKRQSEYCIQIFQILKSSVEIMDEVDLLLHPLKSELNWPLGEKFPLDFTKSTITTSTSTSSTSTIKRSEERYHGNRWNVPSHLLDAVFYCSGMPITADIADSKEASTLLYCIICYYTVLYITIQYYLQLYCYIEYRI